MIALFRQVLPNAKSTSRSKIQPPAVCEIPSRSAKKYTPRELGAILRNTTQPLKERILAAALLSGCGNLASEAVQILANVFRQRGEKRELRIACVIALTSLGKPAFAALREVIESEEASEIEVKMPGETSMLSVIAAQSLLFTPGGSEMLRQITSEPTTPFGWAVAFTVLHASKDPAETLRLLMERARDARFAVPYREAAIYLLGNELPDFHGPYAAQGWDLLASIQLASSESPRLRKAAEEILKLRRL